MITRIEIDGFKSFRNFSVDLKPFQVLIGSNGVGKSNLFDAIVLMSQLAGDNTLYEAFRKNRGDLGELFYLPGNGARLSTIKFAVELLIGKQFTALGETFEVSSTRLRYELHIERREERGFERLYVAHEALTAITEDDDKWFRENIPPNKRPYWIVRKRRSPYISTDERGSSTLIHQDGRSGKQKIGVLGQIERTVLSTISIEYPTSYAVRQEMQNWKFLQFNPEELRKPSSIHAKTTLESDGSNLASALYWMGQENEFALTDISREISNLVPGISKINIKVNREREEFLVEAHTFDQGLFSSRVLSDGTLRLLALVTLKYAAYQHGLICFEEPENGVYPSRLVQIAQLLQSLATDFKSDEQQNTHPRQLLINTHSPRLLSAKVMLGSFLYIYMTNNEPRETRVGVVSSKDKSGDDAAIRRFTIAQIQEVLDPAPPVRESGELRTLEM